MFFLFPLLPAAIAYRLRRTKGKKVEGIERYNAIVVGAGFSGLCVGAKLKKKGVPFTILGAAGEVGGTWHHNSYPGAACDVWTTLYQFSFFPHIKFNTRVLSAAWIEDTSDWEVNTATETLRCKIFISAVGALHKPSLPDIS